MIATLEGMDPDEQRQRLGMALRVLGLAHTAWMEAQVGLCLIHCNAAMRALGDIPAIVEQDFWDTLGINLPLEIGKLADAVRATHPSLFRSRSSQVPKFELPDVEEEPSDPLAVFSEWEQSRLQFMKWLVLNKRVTDNIEGK